MGDWQGAAAAFESARSHLDRGTGHPSREARLLSLEASLATDMGRHAEALALVSCASALYRGIEDAAGVAVTTVKEASVLLAAKRFADAISHAEAALRLLPPREARLELLARSLVTECLVFLGRPAEALRSLQAARPLHGQLRGGQSDLQLTYLVYDALMERYEREVVLAGLAQARGSLAEACRLLGISRNTLRERMSRYGLREAAEPDPSEPS